MLSLNSTETSPDVPSPAASPPPTQSMASRVEKRKLNTLAARRYRQKRLDQISSLEAELKKTQLERDALKYRVAKLEGETEMLKELLNARK